MATLIDYLESQMHTFDEKPLNPIDSAVFTQLALINGEKIVPRSHANSTVHEIVARKDSSYHYSHEHELKFYELLRAEDFDTMFAGFSPKTLKEILYRVAASPRFRNLVVRDFTSILDEGKHIQFSATTYVCPHCFSYIAFRGTDTTLTGWREDFDLTCYESVPAQRFALKYLESLAPHLSGDIYVGGHSKGGNLALYAALHAEPEIQDRIKQIYIHDAPGMRPGTIKPELYERIAHKIYRNVPQASVVGMVMECPIPAQVVECDAPLMAQHSVTNWHVKNDDFVYVDKVEERSLLLQVVINDWLAQFTAPELKMISDALFHALDVAGVTNAKGVFGGVRQLMSLIAVAYKSADEQTREVLGFAADMLVQSIKQRVGGEIGEAWAQLMEAAEREKDDTRAAELKKSIRNLIDSGAVARSLFVENDLSDAVDMTQDEELDEAYHNLEGISESMQVINKDRADKTHRLRKKHKDGHHEKAPHRPGAGHVVKDIAGNLGIQFDGSFTKHETVDAVKAKSKETK